MLKTFKFSPKRLYNAFILCFIFAVCKFARPFFKLQLKISKLCRK